VELSRISLARRLCKDASIHYRDKMHRDMVPKHHRLVCDSITWSVCECRLENRRMNDVFRRAAIIALWWAKGAPTWELFGVDSLIDCLREFLLQEGTGLAPPSSDHPHLVRDVKKVLGICRNPNWPRTCSDTQLLDKLQHEIAKYWACSLSNIQGEFDDKRCHLPPRD